MISVVLFLVVFAAWTGAVVLLIAMWQARGEDQVEHQDADVPYDQELDGTDLATWNEELR